ncbi:MAG: T9SS type A sorting domain-containing protein [Candidatus Kapaibacterium sp.]
MRRLPTLCVLLGIIPLLAHSQPLVNPFTFVAPSYDSTSSNWLPRFPAADIDREGFLKMSGGHFIWADSTPARFIGAGVINSGCFPDSVSAIAMAGHLRKLGVNMVRFDYFDYHNNDAASLLAPGTRSDSLAPAQLKKLDWLIYQLKLNGIHAHFVLKSRNGPRKDDGVPGWDSTYNNGQYITYFSEPYQRMQRAYLSKLLNHVNPYTAHRYADEPTIALMTINDANSFYDRWVNDRLSQANNVLSYSHARLLDTLFTNFLKRRYGTTANLRNAYFEGVASPGPNTLKNPGFESFADSWTLQVGEGAQASQVIVQGSDVAPGDGPNSMRIVVRKVNGNEGRIYLEQTAENVRQGGIYQFRFRAKTDSTVGRTLHVTSNFGLDTTVALTTAWGTYGLIFRSTITDSLATYIRFFAGKSMGDVFLDGISFQETGRSGLTANETFEAFSVYRAKYRETSKIALKRMLDQGDFYDSLARAYYRGMRSHLQSLGVKAPIAGTNSGTGSADTWAQSEFDFTSKGGVQWDFTSTRAGMPGSDSTWVIRNYSVLRNKDKLVEFTKSAIYGKPFIAESYLQIFPNAHRSESMLYLPAYAALQGWDGAYFYCYTDRTTELADRRRVIKDDYSSIVGDPSLMVLLPQVSAMFRGGWVAPATRTLRIHHDTADLRRLPISYFSRGSYSIDGQFNNVSNLVDAIRVDSLNASHHYTSGDYYVTVPADDAIESDTKEIRLDAIKGIMQLNTPRIQGAAGAISTASAIKTDQLSVSWIDGGANATYFWSSLDSFNLDSARRSLLTISTRALNTGAAWQFGDSSLGKNWGVAPTQLESVKLGINFFTAADSVILYPLDTLGRASGRAIPTTRGTSGSWRITLDLSVEKTPWFGVKQVFHTTSDTAISAVPTAGGSALAISDIYPNPASGTAALDVTVPPGGAPVSARVVDMLGRVVAVVAEHRGVPGRGVLPLELRGLPAGAYICLVRVGDQVAARRFVVGR